MKNISAAKRGMKAIAACGQKVWRSEDGTLDELTLRSHARFYKNLRADMGEFVQFCKERAVPEEVLARVLNTVR